MAIPTATGTDDGTDGHEHELSWMPGFRFHPTEEELIEFYLRGKVEGKRFQLEIIRSVDLYRYDPWELPALAENLGGKEWFFYVPRDRKYRNGDRPNRVTASGYWKATGADRIIRSENHRSIGLKKTLVFYSGKAPKGIRTSWIMNEYRLPQNETDRYQKTEISLCRVYKRSGVEDHSQIPSVATSKPSSSREIMGKDKRKSSTHQRSPGFQTLVGDSSSLGMEKVQRVHGGSNNIQLPSVILKPVTYGSTASIASLNSTITTEEDSTSLHPSLNTTSALIPTCTYLSSTNSSISTPFINELNRLVGFDENYLNQSNQFLQMPPQPQLHPLSALTMPLPSSISDKLWEWNPLSEVSRDYTIFK